jgi:hypothetical protein
MTDRRRVGRIGNKRHHADAHKTDRRDGQTQPAYAKATQAAKGERDDHPDQAAKSDTANHRRSQQTGGRLK